MKCLFLAPMKSPDHPVPSGDTAIARMWMRLLQGLGFEVVLASALRCYVKMGSDQAFSDLVAAGRAETRRILADPDLIKGASLVFCYHNYYRAPDCIGPELAAALSVPYVVAEGSRASKRLGGPFSAGEARAAFALDAARLICCATRADRPALERALKPGQMLVDIPAAIDPRDWPDAALPRETLDGSVRLQTIAMMRDGAKYRSYEMLAAALRLLQRRDWLLDIFGDGPARPVIMSAFELFGEQVRFHGVGSRATLGSALRSAELFVWPGIDEAFGMVYLEAQLHGVPCLAGDFGGVADAIAVGRGSQLVEDCDAARFSAALADLLDDRIALAKRGAAAREFVLSERSMPVATKRFAVAALEAGIALPSRSGG